MNQRWYNMCLLIGTKEGVQIPKEHLKNAYKSNRDGVGYSFNRDNVLVTKKFRNEKKFLKQYEIDFKNNLKSKFIVHFRLATDGTNQGTINVHPFKVNENLVFAHNGIISNVGEDKILSDTQLFNRDILRNLPKRFLSYKVNRKLISSFIGNSKLVFLDNKNKMTIINENLGHWVDGIWYSNASYQSRNLKGYNSIYGCSIDSYSGITDRWDDNECEVCFKKSKSLSLDMEYDLMICDKCFKDFNEPHQINFFD